MAYEQEMENSLNPEEAETPDEETAEEEQGTPEENPEKPSTEEKGKPDPDKLYARMKKAETEAKLVKEELDKLKKSPQKEAGTPIDVFDLAKTVSALKEYSPDELGDIQMIAKAKGISPEEAVKTEEAQLIITARREKVAKEQAIPHSSGAASGGFRVKTQEEIAKLIDKPDELKNYFEAYSKHRKREGV